MLGLKRGIVELHAHNPLWKDNAMETIETLSTIFDGVATDIQHVGSTSIARISAKPIIDIAVAVDSFEEVMEVIPDLSRQDLFTGRKMIRLGRYSSCGDEKADTVLITFMLLKQTASMADYINFRDYLNANPNIAREYEAVKISLMKRFKHDRLSYTEGKSEFITDILRKAHLEKDL